MANSTPKELSLLQKKMFYSTIRYGVKELMQASLLFLATFLFINQYTSIIFAVVIFVCLFLGKKLTKYIQKEFIYPRVGFIELLPSHKKILRYYKKVGIITAIITYILFFVIVFTQDWTIEMTMKYVPIFVGVIFIGRAIYGYFLTKRWQSLMIGGISGILTLMLYLIQFSEGRFYPMVYSLSQAILFSIVGGWKFRNFLSNNPKVTDE